MSIRLLYFPPFLLLVGLLPAVIAHRFMNPATRPSLWVFGLRWFLGLLFAISGLAKLIPGFPNTMGPTNLEYLLAPHGLALFARFIGVSEVGIGLLLLTRRFATIGALMLFPMLVSIIIVTTSQQWRGTPFVVSGFLLLDCALLLYDYPKLIHLLNERRTPPGISNTLAAHSPKILWLVAAGVILIAIGAIRLVAEDTVWVLAPLVVLATLVVYDWRHPDRSV